MERNTNQRIIIRKALCSSREHPTAEMVYRMVKDELPAISLATVYRNLHRLADRGEALRLEINGEFHFDGDVCRHQHCVCRSCGAITDMFEEKVSEYAIKHISAGGFQPVSVNIIYEGYCAKCKEV